MCVYVCVCVCVHLLLEDVTRNKPSVGAVNTEMASASQDLHNTQTQLKKHKVCVSVTQA
jgi:hypothetical protein